MPGIAYGVIVDGRVAHLGVRGVREVAADASPAAPEGAPVERDTVFRIASYSNYGYAILGRIVANVSGMPYSSYLRERILLPLGMTVTTLEAAAVPPARLAHGYRLRDGAWLEEPQLPDGAFGPMGGMLTSIHDLALWVAYLLDAYPARNGEDEGPLRRSSRREMQQIGRYNGATTALDDDGELSLSSGGYGYGLGVRQSCLFQTTVAHSGGLPGFGSLMRWLPDHGVGIVALGNLTYTGWSAVVDQAFEALAASGALQPRAAQPAPVLLTRRDEVARLIVESDDALADSLAAMNLFRDEPAERRRAAIEKVRDEAGGDCRSEEPFVAENALRGRWRMRCSKGDLRVRITLAPTEPAQVQWLEVQPMRAEESLEPPPACR
ncbi:MAG TPA: serine hydrolase domain-containing protein [Thermoanaerobaculia bacterium]|nr:serine hydrolase domain-containing protein [Thermoanaerobaculia bacterium]